MRPSLLAATHDYADAPFTWNSTYGWSNVLPLEHCHPVISHFRCSTVLHKTYSKEWNRSHSGLAFMVIHTFFTKICVKTISHFAAHSDLGFYRASATQYADARYWYSKSVRLSVCLSVRPKCSGIRWKQHNISSQFFSPYGSPIILVLPASNIFTKFRRSHPLRGAKYRWGRKNSRFSTNKSLYLANYTKYRHSYYGRWIGTRMRSIK